MKRSGILIRRERGGILYSVPNAVIIPTGKKVSVLNAGISFIFFQGFHRMVPSRSGRESGPGKPPGQDRIIFPEKQREDGRAVFQEPVQALCLLYGIRGNSLGWTTRKSTKKAMKMNPDLNAADVLSMMTMQMKTQQ